MGTSHARALCSLHNPSRVPGWPRWRACCFPGAGQTCMCACAQAAADADRSPAWSDFTVLSDMARADARLAPLAELLCAVLHADRKQRPHMWQVHQRMTACLAALRA